MGWTKRIEPGKKVDLSKIDPEEDGGLSKDEAQARLKELGKEFEDLQELLFAAGKHSLLIVLQGRDTAGKDGSIKRILEFSNVQSCSVAPFKVPTSTELAHDFLWRVHPHAPPKGGIALFNRSHYEDVLVVRVHGYAPEPVWRRRFEHIVSWERLLSDSGTIILKFMLHISIDEQERRLLAREQDVEKSWKLSVRDWQERAFWDSYTEAYEEALERCSTDYAPWHVVCSNKKWFRDLAIIDAIVEALRPYRDDWMQALEKMGEEAKAELAEFRRAPSN